LVFFILVQTSAGMILIDSMANSWYPWIRYCCKYLNIEWYWYIQYSGTKPITARSQVKDKKSNYTWRAAGGGCIAWERLHTPGQSVQLC